MIHDDIPRLRWKLAIIEDVIKSNDGLVHAAHIKTGNCRTTRPIVKLHTVKCWLIAMHSAIRCLRDSHSVRGYFGQTFTPS